MFKPVSKEDYFDHCEEDTLEIRSKNNKQESVIVVQVRGAEDLTWDCLTEWREGDIFKECHKGKFEKMWIRIQWMRDKKVQNDSEVMNLNLEWYL